MNPFLILTLVAIFSSFGSSFAQDSTGNMHHLKKENIELMKSKNESGRIVFMGNSITQGWSDQHPDLFKNTSYINKGISGQTTPQMLARFSQDVIDLQPAIVVILAGINDLAQNSGPISIDSIAMNIITMAEMAKANDIEVILCSVLPAFDFPWRPGLEPAEKVIELNKQLTSYAEEQGIVYVDYFAVMVNEVNGLKEELAYDGIHPNTAGYLIMEPILEKGISEVLEKK